MEQVQVELVGGNDRWLYNEEAAAAAAAHLDTSSNLFVFSQDPNHDDLIADNDEDIVRLVFYLKMLCLTS